MQLHFSLRKNNFFLQIILVRYNYAIKRRNLEVPIYLLISVWIAKKFSASFTFNFGSELLVKNAFLTLSLSFLFDSKSSNAILEIHF
jgi:hypothetical protein